MRNTDHATRIQIVERHLAGASLQQIARDLALNPYTVRKWWRRFRNHGWAALEPRPPGPPPQGPIDKECRLIHRADWRHNCQVNIIIA
ncbi:MAG: helix-turn-helix domain-containing protein [Rhodothermales bacterium]